MAVAMTTEAEWDSVLPTLRCTPKDACLRPVHSTRRKPPRGISPIPEGRPSPVPARIPTPPGLNGVTEVTLKEESTLDKPKLPGLGTKSGGQAVAERITQLMARRAAIEAEMARVEAEIESETKQIGEDKEIEVFQAPVAPPVPKPATKPAFSRSRFASSPTPDTVTKDAAPSYVLAATNPRMLSPGQPAVFSPKTPVESLLMRSPVPPPLKQNMAATSALLALRRVAARTEGADDASGIDRLVRHTVSHPPHVQLFRSTRATTVPVLPTSGVCIVHNC
eukprot:TRINITY_DN8067_c0_g1_i1.p1 TRINITY_DN8067_c0_g1~~TRINITY_DN8067_c0_g1_i1.p1  ORF type:complete len:279 (+),score=50.43 TRINITY_DN8067_c0_g1_i1:39-875(+)